MKKRLILSLILAGLLSGCSVYTLDIQQGNIVDADKLAMLQPGMDKQKVLFILGTPLLRDPFHPERWDYVYTLKKQDEKMQEKRVTLYFDGGKLSRIVKDPASL